MTDLKKPVKRVTRDVVREPLVITLYPTRLGIRALGTRREYALPLATIYRLAIDAELPAKRRTR
jgi:hypothetical protein